MCNKTLLKKFSFILSFMMILTVLFSSLPNASAFAASSSKVSINITDLILSKGKTKKLKISGTTKKVKWRSSDSSVVKVSKKGKVKALKVGKATVTAKVNGKSYKCRLQVSSIKKKNPKILIAYFSQTGTTKSVAKKIQKLTGGDLIRIREKDKYPKDYDKITSRAKKELNRNARPKITSVVGNMKSYDIVFIGYPIWWHSTPKVIDTFLKKNNLKNKTVIPFCTSGGSDISESIPVFKKLCKNSKLLTGYTADSGSTGEIRNWLKNIGILKNGKKSTSSKQISNPKIQQTQTSSNNNSQQSQNTQSKPTNPKTLVAYF